jgi:multiple sugar transport system permease protein
MTSILTLLLGSLAGFAFSRHTFSGENILAFLILWTRTLPPIVAIIPLFLWFSKIGLVDTHLGLVLIYTALNLPFAIWMLKSYFDSVPKELEEAAIIDGCSRLAAFRRITIRLAAPGMAATAIFVAVLAWNEFLFALIFSSVNAKTMPIVVVESIVEYKLYWADMAALGTIVMFPILVFSFFIYKHLVSGLTFGSIK